MTLEMIIKIWTTIIKTIGLFKSFDKKPVSIKIKKQRSITLNINHSQPLLSPSLFDEHEIIFSIANADTNQQSLKMIDWGFYNLDYKSSVKMPFEFPCLIPPEGILFNGSLGDINIPIPYFGMLSNWQKCKMLRQLQFEIELMNHKRYHLPLPLNLKLALFRMYASKSKFMWFYELNV